MIRRGRIDVCWEKACCSGSIMPFTDCVNRCAFLRSFWSRLLLVSSWIGAPGDGGPRWDVYFTRRTSYVMARSCPHLAHTTMHDKSFPTLFDFRKTWSHRSSLWKYGANGQCYRCENNCAESIEQIVNAYDRVLSRQENCLYSSHVGSATVYV